MRAYARIQSFPTSARDALVKDHIDMARRIALRVARRLPDWLTQEDIVAAAMLGLSEAAERYSESRGESFVAFAEKRIRGAVFDELRRGDILPRRVRTMARKVGATIKSLEQDLGRTPEDEEIANALSISEDEYREQLSMLSHINVISIESTPETQNLADKSSAEADTEKRILFSQVKEALQRLQQRDALILSLYYLEELSYAEIGKILEVSESRVCQLHARALARLRTEMNCEETDNG
jgi:RNA polymerase sigma factor for flagellar operon FliA